MGLGPPGDSRGGVSRAHQPFSDVSMRMHVMAGLVPAIRVFVTAKTWMPATSAGMTQNGLRGCIQLRPCVSGFSGCRTGYMVYESVIVSRDCCSGSFNNSGSTKNTTVRSRFSPGPNRCSLKQKQLILEKYPPAVGGDTL